VQPNGRRRVRFKAVDADHVRPSMAEMVTLWDRCVTERWGASARRPCRVEPRLPLHPPVPRRQRPRLAPVVAPAVLPSRLRGRAVHQPSSGLSKSSRRATTRRSSSVPAAGTRVRTIRSRTSISRCSSSRPPTKSSRNASGGWLPRAGRRPTL
jgi:hypothetical protein